jgi:hypothetical protein
MNLNRLQQNHPCVIETIRRRYLHPPADPDVPYVLQAPNASDPSAGQAKSILKYLVNQVFRRIQSITLHSYSNN